MGDCFYETMAKKITLTRAWKPSETLLATREQQHSMNLAAFNTETPSPEGFTVAAHKMKIVNFYAVGAQSVIYLSKFKLRNCPCSASV